MHYTLASLLAMGASAAMINVQIGNGGLIYTPDSITANKGDIIRFSYPSPVDHDVVSGDYNTPCQPNNMIAGPVEADSSMDFFVEVNSTDPMFFYCSVNNHCNLGMVMAVNPSSDMTLATYKSNAAKAKVAQPMSSIMGGVYAASTATPFAAAASSSMMSSSMSSSMSSTSMSGSMSSSMSSMMASMTSGMMSMSGSMASMTSSAAAATSSSSGNAGPAANGLPAAVGAAVGAAAVGLGLLI